MKRTFVSVVCGMFLLAAVGMVATADKSKIYYVCNCQDNCKCNFVSGKAGKCTCGKELTEMHVLAIEKGSGFSAAWEMAAHAREARRIRVNAPVACR